MGKKLYVGNLAYSVTSESLEQMFLEFGTVVSAQVIQDRDTGRSKGFGFVEMQADDAAQRAISGMHEKEFDGRALTVNEAKPRESSGGGHGRSGACVLCWSARACTRMASFTSGAWRARASRAMSVLGGRAAPRAAPTGTRRRGTRSESPGTGC